MLVFLAWSIALIYLLIGTTYRLSLMGAFTAPLVVLLQLAALLLPIDTPRAFPIAPNPWLEFHASISIIAYGAFALACVAGAMYLVQERQLKTHQLRSIFYHLPPLPNLFSAMTRLLWFGFVLYSAGLISGFFVGRATAVDQDRFGDCNLDFTAQFCRAGIYAGWRRGGLPRYVWSHSPSRCHFCGASSLSVIAHEPFLLWSQPSHRADRST